jgi:hypothetical protein
VNTRSLFFAVHGRRAPRRSPRRSSAAHGPARSWKYRAWIRTLGCCCCGKSEGIEAAHTGTDGGTAQKSSDYSCIPLCTDCHTAAPWSHHRDREECERRIFLRHGLTVVEMVKDLNGEWFRGKAEAA